jgi:hypothetical protein
MRTSRSCSWSPSVASVLILAGWLALAYGAIAAAGWAEGRGRR